MVAPKKIVAASSPARPTSEPMPYNLSSTRWHLDTRPVTSVVMLHDLGSSSSSWSPVNEVIGRLPTQGVSSPPINFYMPNLRNHVSGQRIPDSNLHDYVDDVVKFVNTVVEPGSPVHLVGHGFGGKLALLAALSIPQAITSVTAIVDDDVFGAVCAPENRLKLLSKAVGECQDLLALSRSLAQVVKDEEERAALMLNVVVDRIPRDATSTEPAPSSKILKLGFDCEEILKQFAPSNKENTQWPKLQSFDGDNSSTDEVAKALSKDTSKVRCHIVKSALPGTSPINKGLLNAYFSDNKVTEVMQGFKGGFVSKRDAKVIAPVCLSGMGCTESRAHE